MRSLHLLAVVGYGLAAVVPVMATASDSSGLAIRLTALGDVEDPGGDPSAAVMWILLAIVVVGAMLRPLSRWWGLGSLAVGVLIGGHVLALLSDPPSVLWDGRLPDGRPIGGMLVPEPSWGLLCAAVTVCCLLAAGTCALVWGRRPSTRTVPPAS